MNPIEHLLQEHRDIMAQVAPVRRAVEHLADGDGDGRVETLSSYQRLGRMMETQLALHARKEDEALFPALEALLGPDGSPTGVMRLEHQDIHAQGELLRQTLRVLNQVEHPAIEAGGERLRVLAVNGSDARAANGRRRDHPAARFTLRERGANPVPDGPAVA
jgi:iron-sulfur cluster repair protein YtfE (RIC family)